VGLLLAPAVAAGHWVRRIPAIMLLAALLGAAAVVVGLLVSWHAGTAAGATIAAASVALVALSAAGRRLVALVRARAGSPPAALSTAILTAPDQKDAIVAL